MLKRMASGAAKALWRNSACLVLGSGPIQYLQKPLVSRSSDLSCYVKDTNIVRGQGGDLESQFLFVKRSFKSGFMANVHVFPGGVVDEADCSTSWNDLFTVFTKRNPHELFPNFKAKSNLPIYSSLSTVLGIPAEVALRICAIRETFEETGVLLLREGDGLSPLAGSIPGAISPSVKVLPSDQLAHWRRLVHSDARNFIAMCRELHCVPDVFSLVEWSDWLTPSSYNRRFDTIFYLCCTDAKPDISHDNLEVSHAEWLNLVKGLELTREKEMMFSPPQFAEINRLIALGTLARIHCYAMQHAKAGIMERNASVRIQCKDESIVSLTHYDDLYPIEATVYKPQEITYHHCQSPVLRDTVKLKVSTDNVLFEYLCESHTADELVELSVTMSRWNLGPNESWFDMTVNDNVWSRHVTEYLDQYNGLMEKIDSKL